MYGHVAKLAEEIKKGVESVEGVEAKLWQVPVSTSFNLDNSDSCRSILRNWKDYNI